MSYPLCHQTVTVYRREQGGVSRQVFDGCFFEKTRIKQENGLGIGWENRFFLIMPGKEQRVFAGDKVYFGVGPEVTPEGWAGFSSACHEEVGEVAYATPCFWGGQLCHTEAGRK